MQNIDHLTVLGHAQNMQCIVSKLPSFLQNKWRDLVTKREKQEKKIVRFDDLVEFIVTAAETANHPVYGKAIFKPETKQTRSGDRKQSPHPIPKKKSDSFATDVIAPTVSSHISEASSPPTSGSQSSNAACSSTTDTCLYCKENHDIDVCKKFKEMSLKERRNFVKEKNVCFACFQCGHVSKGCLNKRTCKTCGNKHPLLCIMKALKKSLKAVKPIL
ncbi:uncharacterized protein LOC125561061 [Nematostella vectensis]|uniref:uncharacterized protein LOC125561061 n=1 Tax=Nematostella vectensis TaxID=45351 RepID=UPI0020770C38|nr:uncharacterized protein LOC125561061 [Nematostella vectensis]